MLDFVDLDVCIAYAPKPTYFFQSPSFDPVAHPSEIRFVVEEVELARSAREPLNHIQRFFASSAAAPKTEEREEKKKDFSAPFGSEIPEIDFRDFEKECRGRKVRNLTHPPPFFHL